MVRASIFSSKLMLEVAMAESSLTHGYSTTRKRVLGHGGYRRPITHFRRPKKRAAKPFSTSDSRSPKYGRRNPRATSYVSAWAAKTFVARKKNMGRVFSFRGPYGSWAAFWVSMAHVQVWATIFTSPICHMGREILFRRPSPSRATKISPPMICALCFGTKIWH